MSAAVRAKARLRRAAGVWVRRLGLLPGGESDRLGEDDALRDVVLRERVMVFFPDVPTNLYQLSQWYEPLRALADRHPLVVVTQDSRTTRLVRAAVPLPVHCVARSATLDGLVARSDLALALYVAHHGANFTALRHPSIVHVYVGHGESDKDISASNQVKAYDFTFVAGRAAVDRIKASVPLYDADSRTVLIGRPQAASAPVRPPAPATPPAVLYAPTWEGAQPSVAYGSVASHGVALVTSVLDAGMRLTYRPHPRTGANDATVRAADAALRQVVERHHSGAGRVDTSSSVPEAFAAADVLVTDVSSLALDWLPTLKPLVVTVPASAAVDPTDSQLLAVVPRLTAEGASRAADVVRDVVAADTARGERRRLVDYYLGDTTPGAATGRFLDACSDAIALRDREAARLRGMR
jgi:hypothetical protein